MLPIDGGQHVLALVGAAELLLGLVVAYVLDGRDGALEVVAVRLGVLRLHVGKFSVDVYCLLACGPSDEGHPVFAGVDGVAELVGQQQASRRAVASVGLRRVAPLVSLNPFGHGQR